MFPDGGATTSSAHCDSTYGAAHSGELDAARPLNERLSSIAPCPTFSAFARYVGAEIDALDGRRDEALSHYGAAIELAEPVGSTFVQGIASVGRLSNLADAGETGRVLAGYDAVVAYWERTGSWLQQWTTLRNLADLLDSIGARRRLRCRPASRPHPVLDDRRHVLRVARDAITRHAAAIQQQG